MTITSVLWRLAGLMALVCANGFFVAAEFSIVTVRKTRVDQLIAEGHAWAGRADASISVLSESSMPASSSTRKTVGPGGRFGPGGIGRAPLTTPPPRLPSPPPPPPSRTAA